MTYQRDKVLITTVPPAAKGGIAAVHQVLSERRQELNLEFITIGSAAPFDETLIRRYLRLLLQYARFLAAIIKKRNIRVVHINTGPDQRALLRDAVLIFLAKLGRKRVLVQVHGRMSDYQMTPRAKRVTEKALSLSDQILVFSRFDQAKLEAAMTSSNKVMTFPNAIKVSDFLENGEDLRGKLGIPPQNRVVLFLARLVKEKGIYEVLKAIPAIVEKFDAVTFLFAGDGPEKDNFIVESRNNNLMKWVIFAGSLSYSEVIKAFRTADILVLPSYSEGMPMSVLQALAAGVSIVATPVGALPDFLRDGENGFLVQVKDHVQLAEKVLILLENDTLRQRIALANIELAKARFDIDAVTSQLDELYHMI